jgi:phosphohistidine phosphatase SixA
MRRFLNENYGIMRHANDSYIGKKVVITKEGQSDCRIVTRRLLGEISCDKVKIFHSPMERARLTAEIVRGIFVIYGKGADVVGPFGWLSEDTEIKELEDGIHSNLSEDGNVFTLFITHLPQVGKYLGYEQDKWRSIPYSAIYSMDSRVT